jgi:hypothetical protein
LILEQYIQDVLFRQQVCIVPGIGTFTLQHIPAQYNIVDKSLDPPGQRVIFEDKWTDDGSCLEWISLKENLVPAIASRKLEKYIEDFKASLQSGRPLELPGIGSLQADPVGHISFSPENLPGRPDTLRLQPVLRQDAPPPPVTVGTTEVVNNEVVDHYTVPPWELEEQQSRFKWWWVAIPIAAALVATAIWWFVSNQVPTESSAENAGVTTPAVTDTMALPAEVTQTDTAGIVAAQPLSDTLQYYVVFATYSNRNAAEKRLRKMQGWGLNVNIYSSKDSTKFKLAFPMRTTAADTAAKVEEIRKTYGGENGRVYLEF